MNKKPKDEVVAFETFYRIGAWERDRLEQREPSCFNGAVAVRKWRVTFEPIHESSAVIAARLQTLWEKSDNHHHWGPLRTEAAKIGYELHGSPGALLRQPDPSKPNGKKC